MPTSENERKAGKLADEMRELIAKWFKESGPDADKAIARVIEIRKEINSYGFLIDWTASMSLEDPTAPLDVEVTLYKPKSNMSPKEQAIYDEWFKKINGLK